MRLTRCFCPLPLQSGATVTLPAGAATHLTRVLRLRTGAALTLFDGRGGEYAAELLETGRAGVRVRVGEHRAVERESPARVALMQCLARAERMDWIVQKAAELGVVQFWPIASDHSVVQMDAQTAARRLTHWEAVAIGACEQCGRNRLPQVHALRDLEAACQQLSDTLSSLPAPGPQPLRLLLWPQASLSLPAVLGGDRRDAGPAIDPGAGVPDIYLLIGPEGGFSERELDVARYHGFRACRLGPRTLRAETAPLAALACIQAVAGDFI
jgi:16S rRNA (uracil1498-N3)-methyltransferase